MDTEILQYDSEYKDRLKLDLDQFSGPLDLLYMLVKESKIDVKDIFISDVTDQFLLYINTLKELDVDVGSEYMEMAATLLEIKSRMLLPCVEEDTDTETPEQELIRRLDEYKIIKEASEKLREKENIDRLFKAPDKTDEEIKYAPAEMSLDKLLDAYVQLLSRIEIRKAVEKESKEILKDSYTVEDKLHFIRDCLVFRSTFGFFDLFEEKPQKSEIVVTFFALLELTRLQEITVEQAPDGDIKIMRKDKKEKVA